ncbi:hypothetical protein GTA51_18985 [Desulfovibrio aerotolerans]|uniref:Uncharacterized protein n=1 Tax=Solidesulfovibrio aerotolerans TaxID=295255 RepID=A0A7C9IU07_9BACT|nr:hypothetical protein [Solidesulfovibrio aerotolerans]MYL85187.1 hypothetical protein [Solidesulfovibrio aerotolerans]
MLKKIDQFNIEFYDTLGTSYLPCDKAGIIVTLENKRRMYGCRQNIDGVYEAFIWSPRYEEFIPGKLLKEVTERHAELFLEEYTEDDRLLQRLILRFPMEPDEQVFTVGEEIVICIGSPEPS